MSQRDEEKMKWNIYILFGQPTLINFFIYMYKTNICTKVRIEEIDTTANFNKFTNSTIHNTYDGEQTFTQQSNTISKRISKKKDTPFF